MGEENKKDVGLLITRLAQKDTSALREISEELDGLLKAIGQTYYNNFADVEDAVQNLYMTLYEKAKHFRENISGRAWIIKVFINSIKSDKVRRSREKKYIEQEISYYKSKMSASGEQYIENRLFIREITDGLTEEEKELLICYNYCCLSVREIAILLKKPHSTVYYKLKNLQKKLKKFQK